MVETLSANLDHHLELGQRWARCSRAPHKQACNVQRHLWHSRRIRRALLPGPGKAETQPTWWTSGARYPSHVGLAPCRESSVNARLTFQVCSRVGCKSEALATRLRGRSSTIATAGRHIATCDNQSLQLNRHGSRHFMAPGGTRFGPFWSQVSCLR